MSVRIGRLACRGFTETRVVPQRLNEGCVWPQALLNKGPKTNAKVGGEILNTTCYNAMKQK